MRGGRYVLTVERDPVIDTSDDEGKPDAADPARTNVCGCSFAMLSAREAERAGQFAEDLEAAAGMPHGTDVVESDRIVFDPDLNGGCVPDQLAGTWTVGAVRHTRPRLRVLLRRNAT